MPTPIVEQESLIPSPTHELFRGVRGLIVSQHIRRKAHVGLVERVSELDRVTGCRRHVDLVLRDELGAVEVVLLRDESLRGGEDLGIRVGNPGGVFSVPLA